MNQKIKNYKIVKAISSFILSIIIYIITYYLSTAWLAFTIAAPVLYLLNIPGSISSPRNVLFGFYYLWYSFPVLLAHRYSTIDLYGQSPSLAYLLIFSTFSFTFFVMTLIEDSVEDASCSSLKKIEIQKSFMDVIDLFLLSLVMVSLFLFIQKSGGVGFWIEHKGRAFLLRKGSGAQYLLFILSLYCFSFKLGLKKLALKKKIILNAVFIIFIFSISIFLGSKAKIITMILLFFLPSFYNQRTISFRTIMIVFTGLFVMIVGNYFRNTSWMTLKDILPYTLNYFDTFESLLLVLNNFNPESIFSIHYPFNKVMNVLDKSEYRFFDISAYITSLFHPSAWKINATVQYPIEAQMYLALPYPLSIILASLPAVIASTTYNLSMLLNYKSLILVSFLTTLRLMTHYRGGLIYWTDLYMIPFFLVFILAEHMFKVFKSRRVQLPA